MENLNWQLAQTDTQLQQVLDAKVEQVSTVLTRRTALCCVMLFVDMYSKFGSNPINETYLQ